jgi:hypothetical protein
MTKADYSYGSKNKMKELLCQTQSAQTMCIFLEM